MIRGDGSSVERPEAANDNTLLQSTDIQSSDIQGTSAQETDDQGTAVQSTDG